MTRQLLIVALLALAASAASAAPNDGAGGQAVLRAEASADEWARPWFCHNLDCPRYTVVNATDDYEVRNYEAGVWVSTDVSAYAYALATNTGFKRLFGYIDGQNEDAVKIPMTAPVRTRVSAAAGPFCKNAFTVSFFLPPRFHSHPPHPNNPDVYVDASPAFTGYVAQKGGFIVDDYSVTGLAKDLAEALDTAGLAYESESFYLAGYDPPFRLTGRHTEAWLVAQEEGAVVKARN